jgi:hypothetical protein
MRLSTLAICPAVALLAIGIAAIPAHAQTVINFDNLPSLDTPVPTGYGGLDWNNVYAGNGCQTASSTGSSGYCNGVTSGQNIACNGFGDSASFFSTGAFTLNSFELTAAAADEQVTFTGYHLGVPVYQATLGALESGPTLETLDWVDVDSVEFVSGAGGLGTQVVLDDITINGSVTPSVPEPSSIALLGTGLLSAVGVARRRFKARLRAYNRQISNSRS